MRFGEIRGQLNNETGQKIIDSILNVGFNASLVVDRNTFEVLYQNQKAINLLGDRVGKFCFEALCTREMPCYDCPIKNIAVNSLIIDRYQELLDKNVKWHYSSIQWFDGRDAVLATVLQIEGQEHTLQENFNNNTIYELDKDMKVTDSLTQIPNYLKFYRETEATLYRDINHEYAVIVFDIERFKSINDLYGMTVGDEVLVHIANVLKDMYGYEENYARMHSDMFALYLPYSKKGEIIRQIEKIRKGISINDFDFDINTSFGIYLVEDRSVPVNLMCDRAMMAARTIKGDILRFCAFYDEQYRADMLKTNEIEKDMNQALVNRDFKMYLQPKYKLSDGSLVGAEVLCRWIHPTKGIISPMDFIPLFEKNGFILKLDEYMWEEACSTIRAWIDEGKEPIPLSVNISRYHIKHNNLEKAFSGLMNKYKLDTSMLNLEITESLFLDNPEELNRVLVGLQKMGFKLEVDDFGSGFSSLNLIRNINVDTIKIDKDFLDSEIATDKGKIVVNHTINMAKDLNLQVIAEGVETKEHVNFLKSSKCDIAQGFFFARPMPLEEFNRLIS